MKITIKIGLLISFFYLFYFQLSAQIPSGYYDNAYGKKKDQLKTAMKNIISNHTTLTYGSLFEHFKKTDNKGGDVVWDMYSDGNSRGYYYSYTGGYDQCGNYSKEGDCFNREHSMPKSWFDDKDPMYTDLFHLYPTDGYVNGRRSNDPFGEVGSASWTSSNGSKVGNSNFSGYSKRVFEPVDMYKGDFARTYFYMVTCYEDQVSAWESDMLSKNKYPAFTTWAQNLLLKWSRNDPVSQKEIDRNNVVYTIQGNRNPFIDFPQLSEYMWGDSINYAFNPNLPTGINEIKDNEHIEPILYAVSGNLFVATVLSGSGIRIYTVQGQLLSQFVALSDAFSIQLGNDQLYIVVVSDVKGNIKSYKIVNRK